MGRRLLILVGMALAVGFGSVVRLAQAQSQPPAPAGSPASGPSAMAAREGLPDLPRSARGLPAAEPTPTTAEPAEEPSGLGPPQPATPTGQADPFAGPATPTTPPPPPEAAPAEPPPSLPAPPEAMPPAPAEAVPPDPVPPPEGPRPAPLDPHVRRAQVTLPKAARTAPKAPAGAPAAGPAPESNPLPPASEVPGQPPPSAARVEADPFVLPAERLPLGRQALGLTVEVQAPPTLNIHKEATLKIVVRNTGTSDAVGVVVRDQLPDGLDFLGSQPTEQRADGFLFWSLATVPAASERVIVLRVRPNRVGSFDHAATVTMRGGSKSRTLVREPKLKVEQTASSARVRKGKPVEFRITVSNPGDGPVRDVIVRAKLSDGLRHESGEPNDQNLFEQTLDVIEPAQRVTLDPLVADTILGGPQFCQVTATSPDISPSPPDVEKVQDIEVVEPKLELSISGPDKRYADTIASYVITVKNPGTVTARNVRVLATLPVSGRPVEIPSGARWDGKGGLSWTLSQLEPGDKEKVMLPFRVHLGGIELYQIAVEVRGEGGLADKKTFNTDVTGLADVAFDVSERRRSIDVGDITTFQIKIKNYGSKEATRLLISAKLSDNIDAVETDNGSDQREQAQYNPAERELKFPQIDRLGPGKDLVLGIKVKANKPGMASCRVYLMHDDLETGVKLDAVAVTRVTSMRR